MRTFKQFKILSILLFILLFTFSNLSVGIAEDSAYTVANTKDWRALYLLTVHASFEDSDLMYFKDLSDSQIKTKMIAKQDRINVYESNNAPVIKNYASFLKTSGYVDYEVFNFDTFEDLQESLFNDFDAKGYFLFDSEFGMIPVAAISYLLNNDYVPLFLSDNNLDYIKSETKNLPLVVAGKIPKEVIDELDPEIVYTGYLNDVYSDISSLSYLDSDSQWGIMTRIDYIDLNSIKQGLPLFVYFGDAYVEELTNAVKSSNIDKFEVIGAQTAEIATAVKDRSAENIKLMLKYGRTITNLPNLQGKVLDIDSVKFDFPVEDLDLRKAEFHSSMDVLALTFENKGNIDLFFFSSADFSGIALSDNNLHKIAPGEIKTIPFNVIGASIDDLDLDLSTQYGFSIPLRSNILSPEGDLVYSVQSSVSQDTDSSSVELLGAEFDVDSYDAILKVKNTNDYKIKIHSEIILDDESILSSIEKEIPANSVGELELDASFSEIQTLVNEQLAVNLYYGKTSTINHLEEFVLVEKSHNLLTGFTSKIIEGESAAVTVLVVVILILLSLLLFFFKRKK